MSTIRCKLPHHGKKGRAHRHDVRVLPGARVSPVGTAREAIAATHGELRFLGSGIAKAVYSSRDGRRVYKVPNYDHPCYGDGDHCDDEDCRVVVFDEGQSAQEFDVANGRHWRGNGRRPANVAPTSAFVVDGKLVLCQPRYTPVEDLDYYDQEPLMKRAYAVERKLGIADMHTSNCGVTASGRLVLFDLGV